MTIWFPASGQRQDQVSTAVMSAGFANRCLVTAYTYVAGERSVDTFNYFRKHFPGKIMLDSGVYTLMKDEGQKGPLGAGGMRKYVDKYIGFIKSQKGIGPCIEFDCHYLDKGMDYLEDIRKEFDRAGLHDDLIAVWHLPEGPKGFRALLERYKRVAITFRELDTFKVPKTLLKFLLNKNKDLVAKRHIHILGTTKPYAAAYPDNFSCDSASWCSIAMYGITQVGGMPPLRHKHGKILGFQSLVERVEAKIPEMMKIYKGHPETNPKRKIHMEQVFLLACGLAYSMQCMETIRRKTPGTNLAAVDPLSMVERN